jgi:hypothetical protein
MPFRTRTKYSAIRQRYEGPLEALVVLAAAATLPIVVAQSSGDGTLWVGAGDWLFSVSNPVAVYPTAFSSRSAQRAYNCSTRACASCSFA